MKTEPRPSLSLWWAPLDVGAESVATMAAWLSPEERERAEGFGQPLDRNRFISSRGWLRQLLADHLLCSPGDVRFVAGENGKPAIASSDLSFNASRSAGMALFATSSMGEVGVDIEEIRTTAESDIDEIAATYFSVTEQAALKKLPPEHRLAATFQCWACKEAYGKGLGAGLSFPTQSIDSWTENSKVTMVGEWTIHQIDMTPGFAAAVAGEALGSSFPGAPRRIS